MEGNKYYTTISSNFEQWQLYKDVIASRVFVHIILTIKASYIYYSYSNTFSAFAEEVGLTEKQVKSALKKIKKIDDGVEISFNKNGFGFEFNSNHEFVKVVR